MPCRCVFFWRWYPFSWMLLEETSKNTQNLRRKTKKKQILERKNRKRKDQSPFLGDGRSKQNKADPLCPPAPFAHHATRKLAPTAPSRAVTQRLLAGASKGWVPMPRAARKRKKEKSANNEQHQNNEHKQSKIQLGAAKQLQKLGRGIHWEEQT